MIFFLYQNLSQQSDVADLLGGYRPMDANFVYPLLYKEFENLFKKSFSVKVLFQPNFLCLTACFVQCADNFIVYV